MTEAERQDARKAAKKANARENLTPEVLVREHASAVLGLCIAHMKNFHDGEDIMQDVFLKAFTRIDTLRDHTRARQLLGHDADRVFGTRDRSSSRRRANGKSVGRPLAPRIQIILHGHRRRR